MNFLKNIKKEFFLDCVVSFVFVLEEVCKVILNIKNNDVSKISVLGMLLNRSDIECDLINEA